MPYAAAMLLHANLPSLSTLDIAVLTFATICFAIYRLLRVPRHLRHIPKVPLVPLLVSYFSGEVEEQRVKRLVLPFAKRMQTDVVLVYCLGSWMVQVLESKVSFDSNPLVLCLVLFCAQANDADFIHMCS